MRNFASEIVFSKIALICALITSRRMRFPLVLASMDSGALPGRNPGTLAPDASARNLFWTSFSISAVAMYRFTRCSRPETISTVGCIEKPEKLLGKFWDSFTSYPGGLEDLVFWSTIPSRVSMLGMTSGLGFVSLLVCKEHTTFGNWRSSLIAVQVDTIAT